MYHHVIQFWCYVFCRKKGEVRIIGAISIDLNGVSDDVNLNQAVEKTRAQVIFFKTFFFKYYLIVSLLTFNLLIFA